MDGVTNLVLCSEACAYFISVCKVIRHGRGRDWEGISSAGEWLALTSHKSEQTQQQPVSLAYRHQNPDLKTRESVAGRQEQCYHGENTDGSDSLPADGEQVTLTLRGAAPNAIIFAHLAHLIFEELQVQGIHGIMTQPSCEFVIAQLDVGQPSIETQSSLGTAFVKREMRRLMHGLAEGKACGDDSR